MIPISNALTFSQQILLTEFISIPRRNTVEVITKYILDNFEMLATVEICTPLVKTKPEYEQHKPTIFPRGDLDPISIQVPDGYCIPRILEGMYDHTAKLRMEYIDLLAWTIEKYLTGNNKEDNIRVLTTLLLSAPIAELKVGQVVFQLLPSDNGYQLMGSDKVYDLRDYEQIKSLAIDIINILINTRQV